MRRAMHSTVQGYIDVALWDIAGKAADLPIHRLLGTVRHELPAYISSWIHPDSATMPKKLRLGYAIDWDLIAATQLAEVR